MKRKLIIFLGVLSLSYIVLAQVPTITGFTPESGSVGSSVIINGTNFDTTPANNEVFFGGVFATVTSASSTQLIATVPSGASYERISVLVNGSFAFSTKPYEVTFESNGTIEEESFATTELFGTGDGPYESITIDLDEDGLLDVLISNSIDGDISVLRNASTGIGDIDFDSKVDFQVGSNPNEMEAADFDADGKLDVAIANVGSSNISILKNTSNGSISFDAKLDFATGSKPNSIAVGDIDGDGKVDIAVVDTDNDVVSILRNTSSGGVISFAAKVDFVTDDQPVRVTIADIDLDLKPDVLVANASGSLSILINSSTVGTPSLATKQDYGLSGQATHIVTSDFDEDGTIDIAVSTIISHLISGSLNRLEFFRNTSSPGSLSFVRTDIDAKANWMTLSDVNGDGKLDMFFSELFNGYTILENQSTVGSISFGGEVYIGANIFTLAITSDNLDNDGEPDIILTGASIGDGSVIEVYRNLGSGASFNDFDLTTIPLSRGEDPNFIKEPSVNFVSEEMSASATIDPTNRTIDLNVEDCTDPTALIMSFDLSPGASAEVSGVFGSTPQTSGVTANDFSNPINYSISAEDGSNIQNWTVSVSANRFSDNVAENVTVCESYEFDGVNYTTSGQYAGNFTNQDGCDSLVTLNLTILQPDFVFEEIQTCEPYFFDGESRTTSGFYAGFFTNKVGCDSMVTLDLTVYDGVCWEETSWSNGTGPSETENAILRNGYATGASGSFVAKDLTILDGVLLEIEGNNTVEVTGDIQNDGTIELFSGGTLLTSEANTFSGNDIEVIRNTRYADGKYSMVGSPVQQDVSITGALLGPNVYQYDETVPYNPGTLGVERWLPASSEVLSPGRGYAQANKQEIVFVGKPNVGTVIYSGTYTSDDGINEGFNLVSNPYTAALDVADFLTTNTNIAGAIYLWDDNGSDTERGTNADYIVANGVAATNSTPAGGQGRYNTAVGTAQGFFVKLTGSANTDITFSESMRLEDSNGDANFFRQEETPIVRVNLSNEEGLFKQTVIAWKEDGSSTELVRTYDALVFNPTADDLLYSIKQEKELAIQVQPLDWDEIQLGMNVSTPGKYQLSMEGDKQIFLWDHTTDEIIDLLMEDYEFTINEVGSLKNRFSIRSLPEQVLGLNSKTNNVFGVNSDIHIIQQEGLEQTYNVYTMNGLLVMSRTLKASAKIEASSLKSGVYLVNDGQRTFKILLN